MAQGKCIELELPANMKDFLRINGDLFLRGAKGFLMKCVSRQKGLTLLHKLHYDVCGVNPNASLYRLGMANDTKEDERSCKTCSITSPDQAEMLNSELLEEDW